MEIFVLNDNIEQAINQLKRKVQKDGILKQLKLSAFATTRTQKRKIKDQIALRRLKRKQRRGERD
jgi:ribosomal protein S21